MDEISTNEAFDSEDAEIKSSAAPDAELDAEAQEMQAILEGRSAESELTEQQIRAEKKVNATPDAIKIAAVLAVAHGALLVINAVQIGRTLGDMSKAPYAALWLGALIVMAGALFEKQAWAWWGITLFGGLVGVFDVLRVVALAAYKAGGVAEGQQRFLPPLVGAAGVAMLFSVLLLLLPEVKAAFGMTKENPSGFFK